jgi:hypothetical protein
MSDHIPTPRTDAFLDGEGDTPRVVEFARQLERELAVALATLELWRDRAFDANAGEEFVEIASLLGELKTMRRDYEEGWE